MQSSKLEYLIELIESLRIFDTSYESRLLAMLVLSSTPQTASDLSKSLQIPDSKVYPALNTLDTIGLIQIDDTTRPKTYIFNKPEILSSYLRNSLEREFEVLNENINEIRRISKEVWEPGEFMLDNVALLYRGEEIRNELARHIRLTKEELFIFLSTNFTSSFDLFREYIPEISHDGFRLHLVIPPGQEELLREFENTVEGKIKVRTSIWNQNSYIIRDGRVMMNIFHSDQDVALLTNDELMVKNVKNCWDDPNCCRTTDPVDLELPEDFVFQSIELI